MHAEGQALLNLPASPRQVAARREVTRLVTPIDCVCLVAEGSIARFAQLDDGRRQLIAIQLPGDMADLHSLVLPTRSAQLVALSASTIFLIPHAALRELCVRYPNLSLGLWQDCVIDGQIIAQWLVNAGRRTARERVAHLLCELALRYWSIGRLENGQFPMTMTQEQMADALGLTSVHVNRSLKALREDGLVKATRGIVAILDWERLASAAEFEPAYLHLSAEQPERSRATR
ncbi:Crp/Fnr family transcriptional regulator [Sphingomonas sp. IC-11]|uniref:Crp/Fnr family transcriptional regulator n=1 Tax=Sphingomonas sp. IC-11 TaxID=2898528 RepID=UPI001E390A84|nr:Crp/Fnr family transcriptional regulator [Sphingomonas sp. IC-11]MCD2315218.1 Crp/Fnr family transcriptional regulator [Sphingomonas sp. IC-11]